MIFGTAIDNKTGFYWINSADCFAIKIDNYYPIGSGGSIAKYIFSKLWNIKLSCLEARVILAYVIHETTTIDKGSSPPVKISTITNSGNIWFSESDFIDDVINTFSKAEKRFNFFLFKFMTDPGSIEFLENGLRIKNDKQKKV